MNRKVSLVLYIAVVAATLSVTAVAQSGAPGDRVPSPRLSYAVYEPSQSVAKLQLVDRDNHRRSDGDHDRDDRHCYWRDRAGDRYYYRGGGYVGNGYVSHGPLYYPGAWYDNDGRSDRHGWYDRDGRWHKGNPAR